MNGGEGNERGGGNNSIEEEKQPEDEQFKSVDEDFDIENQINFKDFEKVNTKVHYNPVISLHFMIG